MFNWNVHSFLGQCVLVQSNAINIYARPFKYNTLRNTNFNTLLHINKFVKMIKSYVCSYFKIYFKLSFNDFVAILYMYVFWINILITDFWIWKEKRKILIFVNVSINWNFKNLILIMKNSRKITLLSI